MATTPVEDFSAQDKIDFQEAIGLRQMLSSVTSGAISQADSGRIVYATGDISIPSSVFVAGNSVLISNTISSAIQITSTLPIRIAGETTTGDVQLGAYGVATLIFDGTGVKVSGEGIAAATDADALAFFTAAGISTAGVKTAVETFVASLKSASIWTKFTAIYPMVQNTSGTSTAAASYNLKNPAVGQLTYTGTGIAASNTGLIGGGSAAATTGINLNTTTANSLAFGFYLAAGDGSDAGMGAWAGGDGISIYPKSGGNLITDNQYGGGTGRITATNATAVGFYVNSRTSGALATAYRNGTSMGTTTGAQGTLVSDTIDLFRRGSAGTAGTMTIGVAFISTGLTSSEVTSLYNAVVALNTALGR